MTTLLLNAFSINMLSGNATVDFERVPLETARKIAADGLESAVGHSSTAAVFATVLGVPVEACRTTVELWAGATALVGQYRGPRIEEGATELPEGSEIQWYLVHVGLGRVTGDTFAAARAIARQNRTVGDYLKAHRHMPSNVCDALDEIAEGEWRHRGFEIDTTDSGETDVGGNSISGNVIARKEGQKDVVIGGWGPFRRENFVLPPSLVCTERTRVRECTCGSGRPHPGVDGGCDLGTDYCG